MRLLVWLWLPTRLLIWGRQLSWKQCRPSRVVKSIIVFRLDALGDLVLTTPLFRELKRAFPASQLTVVVQSAYCSVLETNPHIDELLTLPSLRTPWLPAHGRRLLSAVLFYRRRLRGRRFDLAISPRWDTDEHLATFLCLLTEAETRVGYNERTSPGKQRYNRGFDRAFHVCLPAGPLQHEVERNLGMVEAFGRTVRNKQLEIRLTSNDRRHADGALGDVPKGAVLVALGIGAQAPGRRWPLERYAAVARELAMQYPLSVVIACAPSERNDAVRLAGMLPCSALISDSLNIRETCALLGRCHLFIGNDTGAAHLAAAMGCPTIVISRHPRSGDPAHSNSPLRFAPWCAASRVLQPEHGLEGCTTRCKQVEPHCIQQIAVVDVVLAAKTMLTQSEHAQAKPEVSLAW